MEDLGKITVPRQLLYNIGSREDLMKRAEQFLDEHEDESGRLSKKDAIEYKKMRREIDDLTHQINDEIHKPDPESEEKLRWIKATQAGTYSSTGGLFGEPLFTPSRAKTGYRTSENYRRNFVNAIRTNFKDQKFLNFLQEGIDSAGGFLLPTEMHSELIEKLTQENILRQICTTIQTQATHKIDIVASAPTASWVSEGADIPISNAEFKQVQLGAYKMAVASKVSNELLADSYYPLEQFLTDSFARAISLQEEETFFNGDGQGKPLGLLPTLAQSASSTLQTTGTEISPDDLITLIYSLDRPYRAKACFLLSDSTLAAIRRLKDATQNFLWTPNFGEEPAKLCGFPVHTSPFLPPPSKGNTCVIFGDFTKFIIGNRGEMTFQPLRELYALQDISAFLMTSRVDCVLADTHAIRALKIRN